MRKLLFLFCFGTFLCSCVGSPKEKSISPVEEGGDDNKTVVSLLKEISLLYNKYEKKRSKLANDVWENGRTSGDLNRFTQKENEMLRERDNQIRKKMNALKGKNVLLSVIPDSLFEVTGGKIRNYTIRENKAILQMTIFVKLKKDFIPEFRYNYATKEYYAPKLPTLELEFCNAQGNRIGLLESAPLFNIDKAKKEAVRGKVYVPAGYECKQLEPGITLEVNISPDVIENYSNLDHIKASIYMPK